MKQSVLTIIEAVVFTITCCLAVTFFSVSSASAAVSATANSAQSPTQTASDVVHISNVTKTRTVDSNGGVVTYTTRFTVTANDATIYIPVGTSGTGAIAWAIGTHPSTSSSLSSAALKQSNRYVVAEGESEDFILVTLTRSGVPEPIIESLRYSTTAMGSLMVVRFSKNETPTTPIKPQPPIASTTPPIATATKPINPVCTKRINKRQAGFMSSQSKNQDCLAKGYGTTTNGFGGSRPGVTPVASTSPVKVYCVSGRQNFPVGTERTSITNASGTTSVITDARFVCRVKDGKGVWEREGSLPGKPTNPICIKGSSVPSNSTQSGGGGSIPRPGTHECLGGTSSSTGSAGMTGGANTPKPGVLPLPCRHLDKMYTNGTRQPTAVGSMSSASSRLAPLVCQNGEWKQIKPQPNAGPATTTRSGLPAVRGASTDVRVQMAAILFAMQEFLDEMKPQQ